MSFSNLHGESSTDGALYPKRRHTMSNIRNLTGSPVTTKEKKRKKVIKITSKSIEAKQNKFSANIEKLPENYTFKDLYPIMRDYQNILADITIFNADPKNKNKNKIRSALITTILKKKITKLIENERGEVRMGNNSQEIAREKIYTFLDQSRKEIDLSNKILLNTFNNMTIDYAKNRTGLNEAQQKLRATARKENSYREGEEEKLKTSINTHKITHNNQKIIQTVFFNETVLKERLQRFRAEEAEYTKQAKQLMKDEKDGSLEMKALMKKKQAVSESIVKYDIALSSKRKLRAEDVDLFMEIYKTGGEKGRKRLVNASKIDPLIVNGFYNQDGTLKPMETITGLINKTLKQQNTKKTSSKQMTSTQNSELVQKAQARLNRTGATKK